jgi:error-prone DNA polymerase
MTAPFAELLCRSSFSFQEGASTPEELVDAAADLGLYALALTDRDGVYGLSRAHRQAKARGLRLICGARLTVQGGPGVALLAADAGGWSRLCRLLTEARCAGALEGAPAPHGREGLQKGFASLPLPRLIELGSGGGLEALLVGPWPAPEARAVAEAFGDHASLCLSRHLDGQDEPRLAARRALAAAAGLPLLATQDALHHHPSRQRLQDVLTCVRLGLTLDEAGRHLQPNRERHLRGPAAMAALLPDDPAALARTVEVADRCRFSLADLGYRYPRELVPEGHTPLSWLRALTDAGLRRRYPGGAPARVVAQIAHELGVIERLDFPAYFLTVWDVVRYAESQGILCQGRGSAANSAVCFVLGITAVDPASSNLLFERFISEERGEPPDIDVDFEHERREEVIQYIYTKYGRHRAAMVCNMITWRRRSALRDVGKALGLSADQLEGLAGQVQWFDKGLQLDAAQLQAAGLDPADPRVRLTLELSAELKGHPRHLGLHSGGFTISDGPLIDLVPVEPATMADRTVLQWDKDDIDTVGFVKIDVLALGMLTAIRRCFDLVRAHGGRALCLASVPAEDPDTYEMISRADTVGIFQIESRAQMSMLPRLQPRTWYDLVIEVSLVRPGPIQGGMVHPYLARRSGAEPVTYAHPLLEPILARTLGVPIFQEQVMAMAVAVGGFTPGEADGLRRAMGAWRKRGGLEVHTERLRAGMQARGITAEYAEQIARQIQGFGEYGFPESHAASFARLVYVSAWLKRHHPAAFTAALLNSQPMGFYSPRALVADLRRHGVEVRPVDLQVSDWDCTLEPGAGGPALRLGLRLVQGLREDAVRAALVARADAPFGHLADLLRRTPLQRAELVALARAGALDAFGPDRRQVVWAAEGLIDLPLFRGLRRDEPPAPLPAPTAVDDLLEDFRMVGLSIRHDPLQMARSELRRTGHLSIAELLTRPDGARVRVAGLVSNRQRPGTASGVLFMTLEDETGMLNLVVWPKLFEQQRQLILGHNLLRVQGRLQRDGGSVSLLCARFSPLESAPAVHSPSRDFR